VFARVETIFAVFVRRYRPEAKRGYDWNPYPSIHKQSKGIFLHGYEQIATLRIFFSLQPACQLSFQIFSGTSHLLMFS
jgi:hypothetical protein